MNPHNLRQIARRVVNSPAGKALIGEKLGCGIAGKPRAPTLI
jgi:hypothetical protein